MPRHMTGRYERVEVITGVARRRRWSAEEKLRMVNELSRPGATVSLVARRNDINSSLLFKWRKLAREGAFGALPAGDAAGFVPVRLASASAAWVGTPQALPSGCPPSSDPDPLTSGRLCGPQIPCRGLMTSSALL